MSENRGFYALRDYDTHDPADKIKIERSIFANTNPNLTQLAALPLERLQELREESAAAERAIFENIQESTEAWGTQAAATLVFDNAIQYAKMQPVKHTSNEWGKGQYGRDEISNMVYKMDYHVYEHTKYDKDAEKSVPSAWDITWSVRTNAPGHYSDKIAGQTNKRYTNKADAEKYLAGRIKAYEYLFTEISPPIPPQYADTFRVNGHLLPGYTLEHEEFYPPERAAEISGVFDVDEKINALLQQEHTTINEPRKELENMNEPLNIKLSTHELQAQDRNGGAWLKLPATAEQLDNALARIGAQGAVQGKDFFISDCEPIIHAWDYNFIASTPIDELNYLAARLEDADPAQLEKMRAAIGVMSDTDTIQKHIEYTHNTDFFVHTPGVSNYNELGAHCLKDTEMINMPEEWKGAVDVEKLGLIVATTEKGVFTEHGYIYPSGDEWKPGYEIPKEYQIMPEQETPNIDYDVATANAPAVAAAIAPAPFVLVSDNPRDKMKEITDKLENGIKGIFESDQYKSYLKTLSKFHNYSMNNCLMIAMQKPDATHVAGFTAWQTNFKRTVQKGEKGIKILAPAPFKAKKSVDKLDASGKPVFKDGKRVKEEQEITVPAFKIATVFDVSQTEGEPLPQLGVSELMGNVDKYKEFFAAVEKVSPCPVGFEKISSGAKGYFSHDEKRIAINEGMSELQNIKTLIHEVAHARIHDIDKNAAKDTPRPDRRTREVEAESIAYAVCEHYGLDTSEYSFGYVASWSGDKQLDTLKSSLDTIRKEADAIITEIDKNFAELTQDKEQSAEKSASELHGENDTFTIYQIKDGEDMRGIRFEAFDNLKEPPTLQNYDKIHTAPLEPGMTVDEIYYTFNMEIPKDFTGHSLSVSDVVSINKDGKETVFYVDTAGFKELPDFLTPKEQAQEKSTEPKGNQLWQEYTAVSEKHPDSIVFTKLGDFYEVMGDKANIVSKELGQAVTARDVGLPQRVPLVGIPAHHFDKAVAELVKNNHKVAIAEKLNVTERLPQPTQPIDLKIVAEYMEKQYAAVQAADPNKTAGKAAFSMAIKRLNQSNERIPDEHPQLKALLSHAAQSPDLATLKERMETLQTDFIQHYCPAAAPTTKAEPAPAPKPPAQGEHVAAIEAKVNAGEIINLSDLSDAIKKDNAANTPQPEKPIKPPTRPAKNPTAPRGGSKKPSFKEELAEKKKNLSGQKPTPTRAASRTKKEELGA